MPTGGTFTMHRTALPAPVTRAPRSRACGSIATDQTRRKNTPLRSDRIGGSDDPIQIIGQTIETVCQRLRREIDHVGAGFALRLSELCEEA
jgi:hypothetical protein